VIVLEKLAIGVRMNGKGASGIGDIWTGTNLLIKLRNGVLSTVLQRHVEWLLLKRTGLEGVWELCRMQ
jgi:hypothetical protein